MNNINYDNLYKKQWNNLYQTDFIGPRKKIVLSLFPKNKGGKNLDIGCGIGDFMLKLIKKGINIEGIDFSKEAIKNAKKKGLNVKLMDCLKLKFKDNTFSTIIAIDVLEHIKDDKKAEEYVNKAKINLGLCELYKIKGFDYKIPEEWFYTLYYCALAILSKFGVESRSQRCTAEFLRYVKDKGLVDYNDEFIDRITVYKEKDEKSDVDKRESARYGSSVKSKEIESQYEYMNKICKKAIDESEEIVYSKNKFEVPKELISNL